ncbi:hypothetical protein [Haliea sp. E17]|uniref:hypothetical protein n=1 Tax=Haliea sp. E17 TaxID=3401576 RepID=UPI003AAF3D24
MENRRRQYVINKKVQFQYALLVVSIMVLAVNIGILVAVMVPGREEPLFTSGMTTAIGIAELILIAAVWHSCVRLSHRVVGPVYVIQREIELFAAGDRSARIRLRKRDVFQSEAAAINASLDKLQAELERLRGNPESIAGGSSESPWRDPGAEPGNQANRQEG